MITDHPIIQHMERDGELPSWYYGPIFDDPDTDEDWEYDARREAEAFGRD
jgi:hypothetical protein